MRLAELLFSPPRVQFGEGARPRAPRKPAKTQRCIFVGDNNTSSASATADREDAIPPGRWAGTQSRKENFSRGQVSP
jgi:hypothetical protein